MPFWDPVDDFAPVLEFLIEEKVDINYYQEAFFQCVRYNDLQSVMHFLRNGMDINVKNSEGLNALWYTVDADIAEYLILHGIDVFTPLVYKERMIDTSVLSVFEKYGIPIRMTQENLDKALRMAARLGNDKMVDYFIRKGADINSGELLTPLLENVWMGFERCSYNRKVSPKIVKTLLQAGAEIDAEDIHGETALHYALRKSFCHSPRSGTRYESKNRYNEGDRYPCQDRSLQALELIKAGADVNKLNKEGYTPLLQAIENGYETIIPVLLKYGADVNFRTASGITPLSLAEKRCTLETLRLLEKTVNK
ncbi:MAG: hypothetical protein LIP01_03700 [Tannerellaceae bacterium]|nr:hypothetical protein [Tannerellaceae bacterium]